MNRNRMKVLITAGPTREYIDPIRFISNPSSGKMGIAIAEEALDRGSDVTVVYGKGTAKPPEDAKVINVETTEEMCNAVVNELKSKDYDIFIAVAASADYSALIPEDKKIASKQDSFSVYLKPTPKIVEHAKRVKPGIFLCAFKAEANVTENELIEKAYNRLKEVGMNLIVANEVGKPDCGFEVDTNEVYIIDANKKIIHVPVDTKRNVAAKIFDVIVDKITVFV